MINMIPATEIEKKFAPRKERPPDVNVLNRSGMYDGVLQVCKVCGNDNRIWQIDDETCPLVEKGDYICDDCCRLCRTGMMGNCGVKKHKVYKKRRT